MGSTHDSFLWVQSVAVQSVMTQRRFLQLGGGLRRPVCHHANSPSLMTLISACVEVREIDVRYNI